MAPVPESKPRALMSLEDVTQAQRILLNVFVRAFTKKRAKALTVCPAERHLKIVADDLLVGSAYFPKSSRQLPAS